MLNEEIDDTDYLPEYEYFKNKDRTTTRTSNSQIMSKHLSISFNTSNLSYPIIDQSSLVDHLKFFQSYVDFIHTHFIKQSEILKAYEENWDDNGAKSFPPSIFDDLYIIVETFYLSLYQSQIPLNSFPFPNLLPNSDGSIDLHWRSDTQKIQILCNLKISVDEKEISVAGKLYDRKKMTYQEKAKKINPNIGIQIASWI